MGAVGHQLRKRLDDDREWNRIIEKARFPIDSGWVNVVDVIEIPEIGFRYLMFVNFYNHRDANVYLGIGYFNAVAIAHNWGMRTIATALHRGGWRTKYNSDLAIDALQSYERPPQP
jgi:hypothetical protein